MRNAAIVFISLLFFFLACKDKKEEASYMYLRGKIGTQPVTMHMHIGKNSYSGVFWYDAEGKPNSFTGEDTSKAGKILLKSWRENGEELIELTKGKSGFQGIFNSKDHESPVTLEMARENMMTFDIIESDSIYKKPNEEDVTCSYRVKTIWPVGKDELEKIVIDSIKYFIDYEGKETLTSPQKLLDSRRDAYISNYIKETSNQSGEEDYQYSAELNRTIQVRFQNERLLCLENSVYGYEGGAHGYGWLSFMNFDKQTKKAISLQDIFTNRGIRALPKILERTLEIQSNIPLSSSVTEAGLFEEGIEYATDNIYLTPQGVGFVYNQYEIGPYSAGIFDIFVRFDSVLDFLQPDFKKIVGLSL